MGLTLVENLGTILYRRPIGSPHPHPHSSHIIWTF